MTKNIIPSKELLEEIILMLINGKEVLDYSINICNEIGIKTNYSIREKTEFEALASRFARMTDIITQKAMKAIFLSLREDAFTFIDRVNLSEKLNIISSADKFKKFRDLRNIIAHEYILKDISEIFEKSLQFSIHLLDEIKLTVNFLHTLKNNKDRE